MMFTAPPVAPKMALLAATTRRASASSSCAFARPGGPSLGSTYTVTIPSGVAPTNCEVPRNPGQLGTGRWVLSDWLMGVLLPGGVICWLTSGDQGRLVDLPRRRGAPRRLAAPRHSPRARPRPEH